MSTFLQDLALAHQTHEGYAPGTRSYRNNNPGNLRAGPPADADGFTIYPDYQTGFAALQFDIRAKIFGTAGSVKRFIVGTHRPYESLVFQDYVSIYAPSADHNNPIVYCDSLCQQLAQYNVHPQTPLSVLSQLCNGTIQRVPDPPQPSMTLEQRLQSAENALQWASPERASMLLRLIARLKKLLGVN